MSDFWQVLARELQGKVIYPNDDSWQCSKQWILSKVHWVLWSLYWSCSNICPKDIKSHWFWELQSNRTYICFHLLHIVGDLFRHFCWGPGTHSHHGGHAVATQPDVLQSGWRLHRFILKNGLKTSGSISGVMWEELAGTTSTYKIIIFCRKKNPWP